MARNAPVRILSILTVLTIVASGARAQTPGSRDAYRASSRISIVNVEVVVTDRDGKPVPGLSAADFEVREDGKDQTITNFYGGPTAVGDPTPGAVPPPSSGEAVRAPEDLVTVVLFVDNAGLVPSQRDEVLRQVKTLLESGWPGPGVQMMLASGSQSVHVVQPLTADRQRLLSGLETLLRESGRVGTTGASGFMNQVTEQSPFVPQGGSSATDIESQLQMVRAAAQQAYEAGRGYLAAQKQFVDSLASIPGRKIILYLSEGFSTRPGEDLLRRFEARWGDAAGSGFSAAAEATRYSLSNEFRTFLQRANSSRLTFFCVPGNAGGGVTGGVDQRYMDRDVTIGSGQSMNQAQSLGSMAKATGGAVIPHNDQVGAGISMAVDDLRNAYVLGYANPHPDAGTYHALKVKVKRDGVIVRHREGYLNKTPDERMAEQALSGVLGVGGANPLGISVVLRSATPEKDGVFSAVVLAVVPIGNVMLEQKGGAHAGQLALWLAVRHPDGSITQSGRQLFPLRIPGEGLAAARQQSAGYTFQVRLKEGEYPVAVAVRDDLAQIDSTAAATIQIGAASAPGAGT